MTKNTHFLEQVSSIFGKDDEIIVVRLLNAPWCQINNFMFLFSCFIGIFLKSYFRDAKVARGLSWQQLNSALL